MGGDRDPTQGWPLREALERFADPDKWRVFAEVQDAEPPRRESEWLPRREDWLHRDWLYREDWRRKRPAIPKRVAGTAEQRQARWQRRQAASQELVTDFRAKLVSGDLIASGYMAPMRHDSQRIDIEPQLWRDLRLDFERSEAKWHELEIRRVLVRRGQPNPADPAPRSEAQVKRRPGPPSYLAIAEEVLREMAARGELTNSMKADSHKVADRVNERCGRDVIAPKTVRNNLNRLYRLLWQEQAAQIDSGDS